MCASGCRVESKEMYKATKLLKKKNLSKRDAQSIITVVSGCITRGENVAAATRYQFAASKIRSPTELASSNHRFDRDLYDAWLIGEIVPPKINWAQDRRPVQCGSRGVSRLNLRTDAMARAWGVDRALVSAENYLWLTGHYPDMVRLVISIECVMRAEAHLHGGRPSMSAREYAELETLNYCLRKCNRVINPNPHDSCERTRRLAESRAVIKQRVRQLRILKCGGK